MQFTGERYVAAMPNAQINYEHWHRYIFTKNFIENKEVIDIACGEGYGSYYMSQFAKHVTGVDIDNDTIAYARATYPKANLQFIQSDASSIELPDNHFADVVVSFETIEHLNEQQQHQALTQIKRLLKPDGILIISTPDKLLYSDVPNYKNEYHIKEFYGDEFMAFLKQYFEHVTFFQQKIFPVSLIWKDSPESLQSNFIDFIDQRFVLKEAFAASPMYYISICSNQDICFNQSSALIDESASWFTEHTDAIKHRDAIIESLQLKLRKVKEELEDITAHLK